MQITHPTLGTWEAGYLGTSAWLRDQDAARNARDESKRKWLREHKLATGCRKAGFDTIPAADPRGSEPITRH